MLGIKKCVKRFNKRCLSPLKLCEEVQSNLFNSGDVLVTALNLEQDVTVKVISCKEVIQEAILRNNLSPQAATSLGEVMICSLMMGAGLKTDETLQVNLVGNAGLRNIMVITDGELACRGMVGNGQLNLNNDNRIRNILGEGEVQVVRNHPMWKYPSNGITKLRDTKIPLNLALYMAESEQRTCVLFTDVYENNYDFIYRYILYSNHST
jgi:redox-regulated HSP33 family molecular chaperone